MRQLAEEQAALRRVATLVAGGARPDEVFTAVADELAHLVGAEATFVSRVDHRRVVGSEPEAYVTIVGSFGRVSDAVPVGFQAGLDSRTVSAEALRTGRPARISGERLASGPFAEIVRRLRLQAAVASPITVAGRQWGVIVAATTQRDLPTGTEIRVGHFMELAATAIANAQAEQRLRDLVETQAALRRLAMLVARGNRPKSCSRP